MELTRLLKTWWVYLQWH